MPEVNRLPSRMLQEIPAEKIPELLTARAGFNSLLDHINHLKALVEGALNLESGGAVTGPVDLNGGATVPKGKILKVDGDAIFNGSTEVNGSIQLDSIDSIAQVETDGNFGVSTVLGDAYNTSILTTETLISSFTPTMEGNYLIYLYVRVENSDTNVTIKINYTDAGGQHDYPVLDDALQSAGVYVIPPIYISSIVGQPIDISAIAGVSNRVFVSASIIGL